MSSPRAAARSSAVGRACLLRGGRRHGHLANVKWQRRSSRVEQNKQVKKFYRSAACMYCYCKCEQRHAPMFLEQSRGPGRPAAARCRQQRAPGLADHATSGQAVGIEVAKDAVQQRACEGGPAGLKLRHGWSSPKAGVAVCYVASPLPPLPAVSSSDVAAVCVLYITICSVWILAWPHRGARGP